MIESVTRRTGWTAALFATRRRALASSAVGLAMVGLLAGQAVLLPATTPAFAETPAVATSTPFSFADIVAKVRPAVVSVRVKADVTADNSEMGGNPFGDMPEGNPFEFFFKKFGQDPRFGNNPHFGKRPQQHRFAMAQGSGFFISADGYIVTNNHVVDSAEEVTVVTDDGKTLTAKVIGSDDKTDLALLKVDGEKPFPFVSFATSDLRIGDWVVAVGNPFGLGGTVTAGIVSARGRDIGSGPYDDFIQIDAPINKGNSGGPTFNLAGEVVGVNTAIFSPSGGSVGIGFAIPSETVQTVIASLRDHGSVTRGWLGIMIQPITEDIAGSLGLSEAKGALVTEPQDGSPAAKAGVKAGDAVLSVNGEGIDDSKDLARRIAGLTPGSKVALEIVRDGKKQTIDVTLGTYPTGDKQASNATGEDKGGSSETRLGLALAPAAEVGAGDAGVAVMNVDPDGPAAEKGIA
ncbi:MAG: Do family serine endopeptidase, partial [Hyphomicrobiales bacterium]